MRHLAAFTFVLFSISVITGCKTGTEATLESDCGDAKSVCLDATVNSSGNFFQLETPEARNDCEAEYFYYFRWDDPLRRAAEQSGHEEMPPIEDLEQAFQPGGEFAYFPHPKPSYYRTLSIRDCNGKEISGEGWWSIKFSTGNKNSSNPTTRYFVRSRLNPATAGSLDDTRIVCTIIITTARRRSRSAPRLGVLENLPVIPSVERLNSSA